LVLEQKFGFGCVHILGIVTHCSQYGSNTCSASPVEKGTKGTASKVSTHALIAVDEEPSVLRRSLLSSNVERSDTLAAEEVIPLRSPLAVSAKSSVESCTNRIPKECPEVKLRSGLHVHGGKDQKAERQKCQLHPVACSLLSFSPLLAPPLPYTSLNTKRILTHFLVGFSKRPSTKLAKRIRVNISQ